MQTPKPPPSSFATESYYGLTAVRFLSKDGAERYGRYRILPEEGNHYLDPADVAGKGPNYLFEELEARIAREAIRFKVVAQLAAPGDTRRQRHRAMGRRSPIRRTGQTPLHRARAG